MIDFLKFINQSDEDKYNMLLEAQAEIHKLEQENQSLKKANKILRENAEHNDKLVDDYWWKNKTLKDRMEKAIEYIEKRRKENVGCKLNFIEVDKTLEILKGENDIE